MEELSFELIRWNMWPKYVQRRNESLKLKHRIKKKNCTIKSSIQKIPKEKYWKLDVDRVPQKRWTLTEGAKLCYWHIICCLKLLWTMTKRPGTSCCERKRKSQGVKYAPQIRTTLIRSVSNRRIQSQ